MPKNAYFASHFARSHEAKQSRKTPGVGRLAALPMVGWLRWAVSCAYLLNSFRLVGRF